MSSSFFKIVYVEQKKKVLRKTRLKFFLDKTYLNNAYV